MPADQPTVVPSTTEELLKAYAGWGSDALGLLSCIHNPDKWVINVVYPALPSYARDKVAVLGDAVSFE